jgi:hypothetical protein
VNKNAVLQPVVIQPIQGVGFGFGDNHEQVPLKVLLAADLVEWIEDGNKLREQSPSLLIEFVK